MGLEGKILFELGAGCLKIHFLVDPNILSDQEWHEIWLEANRLMDYQDS